MVQHNQVPSLFRWVLLLLLFSESTPLSICDAKELESSRWLVPAKSRHDLDLYIHRGLEYSPTRAFTDIFLQLNLTDEDTYDLYKGDNCSVVEEAFHQDNRIFGLLKGVNLWKSHYLNVFNDTVVGISTRLPYSVQAKVMNVNYIRLGVFVAGVLLFLFANRLVRNAVFYYGSGCSFGLLASLLIIVFIFYRMAPKKLIGLPILIGGWSFSVYILHFVWKNFASIAVQYQNYLAAYFVTVMAISFAVCYKRGPPTDSRSHDIAQWALQTISLLLIYSSSQVQEVAVGTIVLLLLHQLLRPWLWYFLYGLLYALAFIWSKFFRSTPTRRLLTLEEYEQEGREVTKRELQRLRDYCRSPDADVWKITSKVHDPRRLARFVDGKENHVSEEEEDLYEEDSGRLDNDYYDEDEEDRSSIERRYSNSRYLDEDDGEEWEEEVVIRRTPKRRYENYSNLKESSFRRSAALPKDGSRLMEIPSPSRSPYYQNSSSQQRYSSYRQSSASPSRRYTSLADKDTRKHDLSFSRQHTSRLEESVVPQKRTAPSNSGEFISSDSEPDLQGLDDNVY